MPGRRPCCRRGGPASSRPWSSGAVRRGTGKIRCGEDGEGRPERGTDQSAACREQVEPTGRACCRQPEPPESSWATSRMSIRTHARGPPIRPNWTCPIRQRSASHVNCSAHPRLSAVTGKLSEWAAEISADRAIDGKASSATRCASSSGRPRRLGCRGQLRDRPRPPARCRGLAQEAPADHARGGLTTKIHLASRHLRRSGQRDDLKETACTRAAIEGVRIRAGCPSGELGLA